MAAGTIVIFGAAVRSDGRPSGAMRERVEAALRHAARLGPVHFMPTGAVGRYGAAEAEVMADLLRARGIAPERILVEPTGRNTIGSVRACTRLLGGQGPVYAATSAYHMPRCLILMRLAGLDARPCPPPHSPASARLRKRWYWRMRELPAIPVDAALLLLLRCAGRW